ncbi:hypothetical protein D3C71_235080 [compost metagenome]
MSFISFGDVTNTQPSELVFIIRKALMETTKNETTKTVTAKTTIEEAVYNELLDKLAQIAVYVAGRGDDIYHNIDRFKEAAAKHFNVAYDDVTPTQRATMKQILFHEIYGGDND